MWKNAFAPASVSSAVAAPSSFVELNLEKALQSEEWLAPGTTCLCFHSLLQHKQTTLPSQWRVRNYPAWGRQRPHPGKSGKRPGAHSTPVFFPSRPVHTQGSHFPLQSFRHLKIGVKHFAPGCGAQYLLLGFQERVGKSEGTFPTLRSWLVNAKDIWPVPRFGLGSLIACIWI